MKRNSIFSKLVAGLLCVMMVVGLVPASVFAAASDYESPIDKFYGTAENPIEYTLTFDESQTVGSYTTETQFAGETLYYATYLRNGIFDFSVTGEGEFSVLLNGEIIPAVDGVVSASVTANPRMGAFTIAITNDSDAVASYEISFAIPVGSQANPEALVLGYNETAIEGNGHVYYYTWTADEDGILRFFLESIDEGVEGDIVITNNTSYVQKSLYADAQQNEDGISYVDMPIAIGDEISVEITTIPDASLVQPAATVAHSSMIVYPAGTEKNPIALLEQENLVYNVGTTYYFGRNGGTTLVITGEGEFTVTHNGATIASVDGVVSVPFVATPWQPGVFTIEGDGEFVVTFVVPVGTMENPAVAQLGDNVADIAAGTDGYYFTYTAEKAGDLIVTISGADNWFYVINNMTTYAYGDGQWSDSDPVVNPATIAVAEGDEIQINVNGYDPANPWTAPAANLNVNLAYKQEVVAPTGAAALQIRGASLTLGSDLKVVFTLNKETLDTFEDVYFVFRFAGKEIIMDAPTGTNAKGQYLYAMPGVAPRMMNDLIEIELYGTYQGVQFQYTNTYKAVNYCYTQLGKSTTKVALKALIVDLLNFATAHQVYMSYNVENPANWDLTDDQKALAGTHELNCLNQQTMSGTNNGAAFKGATLTLSDAVIVRYTVECADLTDDVTLNISVGGKSYEIPASEFIPTGTANRYYVNFKNLYARQMREVITSVVCRNGESISQTATYSVDTFVSKQTKENVVALCKAMMYYGDAAKAYLG